jgi:hypothetical protein
MKVYIVVYEDPYECGNPKSIDEVFITEELAKKYIGASSFQGCLDIEECTVTEK